MPLALPTYVNQSVPIRSNRENNRRQSVIHGSARTLQDYQSQSEGELSFSINQTFIVLPEFQHANYYLVFDLATQTKGFVYKRMVSYLAPKPMDSVLEPTSSLSSSSLVKNKIGFVTAEVKGKESGYLEVNLGDALLIIDCLDGYFLAKPIGKLGIPGKILKSHVRVQENHSTPSPTVPNSNSSPLTPPNSNSSFDQFKDKFNHNNISNSNSYNRNSKLKFSNRRLDGGRGSITSKSFYSVGFEFLANELDINLNNNNNNNNSIDKYVVGYKFIQVDGIYYIPLVLNSSQQFSKVFRRNDELLHLDYQLQTTLHYKISESVPNANNLNLTFQPNLANLNQPRLPQFPKLEASLESMAQYLLDLEVYFFDWFSLELEVVGLTKLLIKFFKLRETDFTLQQAIQRNLLQLNPIIPTPPLSQQLNFFNLNQTTLEEEPNSLDVPTLNLEQSTLTLTSTPTPLKVKLEFESNLFAFNLPIPSFSMLHEKIIQLTGFPPQLLQSKDLITKAKFTLDSKSWAWVLQSNPKSIYIYVTC